jgi:hypothetical protein
MSQSIAVQSSDPLPTRYSLSLAAQQLFTMPVCSINFRILLPLLESQIATVLSAEQDKILEGLNQFTCKTAFLCPVNTL